MRTPSITALAIGLLAVACNSTPTTVVSAPLPAPDSLGSVSLNRAIELHWADNAYQSAPSRFQWYAVYSTSYDLDRGLCGTSWVGEGTTVAPEFLVGALTNGVPQCYTVTAIATDGSESERSALWQDTPRPDARNVLVYASAINPGSSAFRFWDDVNNDGVGQPAELGLVQSGTLTTADFVVHLHPADSTLWVVPVYMGDATHSGTTMRQYGTGALADLTSIDYAPAAGYTRDSVQARPGYGYVFQMDDVSGLHYGALRLTHVGRQYLIVDWSVQTDPGNPELVVHGGMVMAALTGSRVPATK